MKTIFNKEGINGIEEMQEYCPQISGRTDFNEIKPDVAAAQEEVAKYVGSEIVLKAIKHYSGDNFRKEENTDVKLDTLVELVQNAVSLLAYRDFAKTNDVTHTPTGRKARSDKDHEEVNLRLIDADDLALLQKGLKAIDRLIKYIDVEKFDEWTNSQPYKSTRELLLWNAELFDRYFPIDANRRIFILIAPMVRKVQIDRIKPRLGSELYASMLEKVQAKIMDTLDASESSGSGSGSSTGSEAKWTDEDQYLYDLICYPIAELAISEAYTKLPIQLFPEAMAKQFWSAGNGAAALSLIEKSVKDIERNGLDSLERLENELSIRKAQDSGTEITDDTIVDIVDRMDAGNKFARV